MAEDTMKRRDLTVSELAMTVALGVSTVATQNAEEIELPAIGLPSLTR
jgi:hypothetical protein